MRRHSYERRRAPEAGRNPSEVIWNPAIFLIPYQGKWVLWDTQHHRQFEVSPQHWRRLGQWIAGPKRPSALDQDLIRSRALLPPPRAATTKTTEWGWDPLSRLFHMGTRDIAPRHSAWTSNDGDDAYFEHCAQLEVQTPVQVALSKSKIPLPQTRRLQASLHSALHNRKTTRDFDPRGRISKLQLATVLKETFGQHKDPWPEFKTHGVEQVGFRRTSPSGGGLNPCAAYVIVRAVRGIRPGIYQYDEAHHTLHCVRRLSQLALTRKLRIWLCDQSYAADLAAGIFVVADFSRSWWKYPHSRGYRSVLIDAGHLSQTALLAATALGVQTWVSGAFRDSSVASALRLRIPTQDALFFVGLGRSKTNSAIPRSYFRFRKQQTS